MLNLELSRSFVRSALEQYAAFFRSVASEDSLEASRGLQRLEGVDRDARLRLKGENWTYYRTRKSRLCGLFRKKLMMSLETEVEKQLIEQAERLVEGIEVFRDEPSRYS